MKIMLPKILSLWGATTVWGLIPIQLMKPKKYWAKLLLWLIGNHEYVLIAQVRSNIHNTVFCPWCGSGLIEFRAFWFPYSPVYALHLIRCARPHGIGWFLVYYSTAKACGNELLGEKQ